LNFVAFCIKINNITSPPLNGHSKGLSGMKFRILIIATIVFCLCAVLTAQQQEEKSLESVRKEIVQFQKLLAQNAAKEKSVLQNLQELDQDIRLRERYLGEIVKSERSINRSIKKNKKLLNNLNTELTSLRASFKSRAVNMYKHGRTEFIDLVFDKRSASQMLALRKYFAVLAERDRKKIDKIVAASNDITRTNESLSHDLARQQSLENEANEERASLNSKKNEREQLLAKVRSNKNRVQLALEERKRAERELQGIIVRINGEVSESDMDNILAGFENFPRAKGVLPWPVDGNIVTHTGLESDPKTKTKTINRGIDILTGNDAGVVSVSDGRVAKIKWLPWYGQTVFVQHTDGYYTVYARLSEISVRLNQVVEKGQLIGRIEHESASADSRLHFQIWKGAENLNPEDWLSDSHTGYNVNAIQAKKNQ